MIPPLEKKKPFLHFVRIPKDSPDRAEYERIYEELQRRELRNNENRSKHT